MDRQHLYFIGNRHTGLVKIGIALKPEYRMRDLEQACGVRLTLLGVLEGGWQYEERLHLAFGNHRRVGEWFDATDEIMALAADPARVPAFIRANQHRIDEAGARLLEARKMAGFRWRAAAIRAAR